MTKKLRPLIITFSALLTGMLFAISENCSDGGEVEQPRLTPAVKAVQKILPSVVNISTRELVRVSDPFEEFYHEFFNGPAKYYRKSIPLGSGIVIDETGLIITNYHVVRRASNIMIMLPDGKNCRARIVAFEPAQDIALLKMSGDFNPANLAGVEFAPSEELLLGETVIAVGNPFGLGNTVTTGVLSATNRSLREGNVVFDDILQTDAAINPGNSGGPLINLEGQFIGMNLAIRRGAEGIGFAVPASRIEQVLARWLVPSQFSDSLLGITIQPVNSENDTGIAISGVIPRSPAAEAHIKAGLEITSINSKKVNRVLDAGRILWDLNSGDKVVLKFRNHPAATLRVEPMTADQLIERRLQIKIQQLTPPLKEAMGLPDRLNGVAVSEVKSDQLRKNGMRRGNIIYRINDTPVADQNSFAKILRQASPGESLMLHQFQVETFRGQSYLDQLSIRVILR